MSSRAIAHLVMAIAVVITFALPAYAVQPDEIMPNAKQEQRARELSRELRCMVCQNQSIDDSEAPLARDLRLLVRERIAAGDSNNQVMDFLVVRYGEFVLLKPRFEGHTLVLWLVTPALLIGGGITLWWYNRRRGEGDDDDTEITDAALELTPEETARVEKLLAGEAAEKPRV